METMIMNNNLIIEAIINFLESKRSEIFKSWEEGVLIDEMDIHKNEVINNGVRLYEFIIYSLKTPLQEEEIQKFAYKIAVERVEAETNIGDFVYNINKGRSIIIRYVNKSGMSIEELQPIVDIINVSFDRFGYYAVKIYTELKDQKLQEKVLYIKEIHNDRLSILGQMSSSFVHEFRNPLTSVIGFIKLLKSDHPELKYMDTIELELDQLKYRITQFLHASKLKDVERGKQEFQVFELIEDIKNFLYPSIVDNGVQVHSDIDHSIKVKAYKDEIKQVFTNIIMNSIDALRLNMMNMRTIHIHAKLANDQVVVKISNNGPIIPPAIRETIFEPFYTTKDLGTGIGLYVCKNIIEKHSGKINCESNDKVTSFIISLPTS